MRSKYINAKQAASLIKDYMTVAVSGFLSFGLAEDVLTELEQRYLTERHPERLCVVTVAGLGGDGKTRGINHFAHSGFLGCLYTSNLSMAPNLYPLIERNEFPVFMAPQGVMSHMMRAIAGQKPGVITKVGLGTFVDPRLDGGCVNEAAKTSGKIIVEQLTLKGQDYLFYPTFSVDVAIIKGTSADETGNISIDHEAIHLEQFEMAAAAKNSGGVVIVQVDKKVESIHPQDVTIPAKLVDYVVVGRPEHSKQHYAFNSDVPSWCGDERVERTTLEAIPLDLRKVICRRAALEIHRGDLINLGIGIPTGVSSVLNEEGLADEAIFSIESGVMGGVPASGLATGAAYNPDAILKQPDVFDLYDGGGIDIACLGAAEIDRDGNVNVSRFSGRMPGPGGFINISQGAKVVCFLSTFVAGASEIKVGNGSLSIQRDGKGGKFKEKVEQITFSAKAACNQGQRVLYITERAVFELTPEGIVLTEIAPGVDLQRDILRCMEFVPRIALNLKKMDHRLFREIELGLVLKGKMDHE